MKYKDKNFNIFGTEYTIYYKNSVYDENGEWLYGLTTPKDLAVEISTKYQDGKKLPDRVIKNTLLHELMHVIFGEGAYLSCNSDEPLVEWTAKCLLSFSEQGII